jgi:hypothetical protein
VSTQHTVVIIIIMICMLRISKQSQQGVPHKLGSLALGSLIAC